LNRRAFVIGVAAALATRRAGEARPTKMARVAVLASSTEGNFGPSGLGMAAALEHRRGNVAHDGAH
jgi:hypothetical protein